jgi:protocatechuate 4,5-dioxygenase beta chain
MARIVGGVGTSHTPGIGRAMDEGRVEEPYWRPVFAGYDRVREWVAELKPDVAIIVYNDHASAFSMQIIPTFAIGVAPKYLPADEGYGPRAVPPVAGADALAWHVAESLIVDEFDMTICNELPVDHGLTVPLSVVFGQPDEWPVSVIPIAVNMIQYPPPSGARCFKLGQAIRRAVESYAEPLSVVVLGTGGMSHQLQGERAGLTNPEFDGAFLDRLGPEPAALTTISHTEYMRSAGTEGMELVMWLVMRGALDDVREVHRHYHIAASNTSVGLVVYEPLVGSAP